MKKVNSAILEEICKISNKYMITPKDTIKLYNKAMTKSYITHPLEAIELITRYAPLHYPQRRRQTVEWGYDQIIAFQRYKR
jgi:hypothetical protein